MQPSILLPGIVSSFSIEANYPVSTSKGLHRRRRSHIYPLRRPPPLHCSRRLSHLVHPEETHCRQQRSSARYMALNLSNSVRLLFLATTMVSDRASVLMLQEADSHLPYLSELQDVEGGIEAAGHLRGRLLRRHCWSYSAWQGGLACSKRPIDGCPRGSVSDGRRVDSAKEMGCCHPRSLCSGRSAGQALWCNKVNNALLFSKGR